MPITLLPNRRRFLAAAIAGGTLLARGLSGADRPSVDPVEAEVNLIDTDIGAEREVFAADFDETTVVPQPRSLVPKHRCDGPGTVELSSGAQGAGLPCRRTRT